jgi:hypothetical protein
VLLGRRGLRQEAGSGSPAAGAQSWPDTLVPTSWRRLSATPSLDAFRLGQPGPSGSLCGTQLCSALLASGVDLDPAAPIAISPDPTADLTSLKATAQLAVWRAALSSAAEVAQRQRVAAIIGGSVGGFFGLILLLACGPRVWGWAAARRAAAERAAAARAAKRATSSFDLEGAAKLAAAKGTGLPGVKGAAAAPVGLPAPIVPGGDRRSWALDSVRASLASGRGAELFAPLPHAVASLPPGHLPFDAGSAAAASGGLAAFSSDGGSSADLVMIAAVHEPPRHFSAISPGNVGSDSGSGSGIMPMMGNSSPNLLALPISSSASPCASAPAHQQQHLCGAAAGAGAHDAGYSQVWGPAGAAAQPPLYAARASSTSGRRRLAIQHDGGPLL